MPTKRNNNGAPATRRHIEAVRRLVADLGEERAAAEIGISRSALPRVVAGFGLRRGTHALLARRLGDV